MSNNSRETGMNMEKRRKSIHRKRALTLLIAVCVSLALIDAIKAFALVWESVMIFNAVRCLIG